MAYYYRNKIPVVAYVCLSKIVYQIVYLLTKNLLTCCDSNIINICFRNYVSI
jgi:hypothetical protein